MVIGVLAAIGGLIALFGLLDLTDFLLVRAGKQPMPGWRRRRDSRFYFRERGDPRRSRGEPGATGSRTCARLPPGSAAAIRARIAPPSSRPATACPANC